MNKIFFSDLDGTLLTTDKHISPITRVAIDNWLAKGNYLALTSGRPLGSILAVMQENGLSSDRIFAIGFGGSIIYHPATKETLYKKSLPLDLMKPIIALANDNNVYCHSYDNENILIPDDCSGEEIEFYTRTVRLPVIRLKDFANSISEPSCKLLAIDLLDTEKLDSFGRLLEATFPNEIVAVKSSSRLLEINPYSISKGEALNFLCKHLGIAITDSFAAGDEANDISMVKAAGLGIALLNGKEALKEIADVVTTTDNDHDGLAEFFVKNA